MDEKTIYQKYDELLASNTALSVENAAMAQRIDKLALAQEKILELQNQIIDLKACLRTCANSAQGGLDQYT